LAALRSGGFLAQMFNRGTKAEPCTKLLYEALHRHYAKPLLAEVLVNKTLP